MEAKNACEWRFLFWKSIFYRNNTNIPRAICGARKTGRGVPLQRVATPQARSDGISAMMSISIRYSGLASPCTMMPVETGKTPFSHWPTTR